jgi:zinc transport system substrate-binding protein
VWLDPVLMKRTYELIRARLGTAGDPVYAARLGDLDARYERDLAGCERHTIVTAHEAFGHLAARYGLVQHAIAGVDPQQEPDADRIAELADLVRREHDTTIFTERLVSARVAETLAREAGGLRTAVLDPIESASARDGDYQTRMARNLDALKTALNCQPAR